ncbi:MAG TPA: RNA polymerase sigma factor [Rhizomicrobium sp.]|jgi:RNA polymerase sigma-70 factor (ECF subfamily)
MRQTATDYAAMAEEGLLPLARRGDHDAFRAIMQRFNQRLFRVARAVVHSDDEAEDVLQEAYLKAFAAIGGFRGESGLATWLTAITLNEARGRLRRRRPTTSLDVMEEIGVRVIPFPGLAEIPDPEAEALRSEVRGLLEKAIDGLPEDFRIVFILREVEGCSVEETAAQLQVNAQTVRTRLFRARQSLRQSLAAKLASGVDGVFPFMGARCSRIADRVLAQINASAPPD